MPARLFGKRKTGGKVEIFIIDKTTSPAHALIRPSGRIKTGESILLDSGDEARILERAEIGRFVEFTRPIDEILEIYGHVPLPPYIWRTDEPGDKERYQTVYASIAGATASPTAGLHFTKGLIEKLKKKGVKITCITLHVSYGTFAPVKEEIVEKHKMHSEFFHIPKESVSVINEARKSGAKIIACGTTSLRALEASAADFESERNEELEGFTNLFVYPGYKFKIINSLITNFHLPKSTLLLLTSAFCGKEFLFKAYEHAIKNKFRFFSYGDAMLIV
jgi:S-adenosylmethionine:tRNA ribosyltransferase-isomerase